MSELALQLTWSRKPDWAFGRFLRSFAPPEPLPPTGPGHTALVPRPGKRDSVALAVPRVDPSPVRQRKWPPPSANGGAGQLEWQEDRYPRLPTVGRAMHALAMAKCVAEALPLMRVGPYSAVQGL